MKKLVFVGWLCFLLMLSGLLMITVACGDDDDDDDSAGDDDDDTSGDDDDDTGGDDDDDDDDTGGGDCPLLSDDGSFDFYLDPVTPLAALGNQVISTSLQGHDVLAAMAFLKMNSATNFDTIEWDMIDGVPAGNYVLNLQEGDSASGLNNSVMVAFGLDLSGSIDSAYISVKGCLDITSTGGSGDQFTGSITNVQFRPIDVDTGAIDWSGPIGFATTWDIDATIMGAK